MMGICNRTRLRLTEYAAGELDSAASAEIDRHLDGCPACRGELEIETELRATLGSLPRARCPVGVGDRVPAEAPRGRPRWPWAAGLAAAAALAVVLLGGPAHRPAAPEWTEAELAAARHDMIVALEFAADVIERSEKAAVVQVFGERLPRAVTGSLKLKSPQRGDEG